MTTRLVELKNTRGLTVRGIFVQISDSTSNTALVCVPGFEGISSTAPKFVHLTKALLSTPSVPISSVLRYDPTGIGLSDGEYHKTTLDTLVDDLSHVVTYLSAHCQSFIFVGHSVGCCVITRFLQSHRDIHVSKIILLAPALNQYELHRFWYMASVHPSTTWKDYKELFDETQFQKYLQDQPRGACKTCRAHRITYEFIRLCSQEDFSFKLTDYYDRLLYIHGDRDSVVPRESINDQFTHTWICQSGDHDLEEPSVAKEWIAKAVDFICHRQ